MKDKADQTQFYCKKFWTEQEDQVLKHAVTQISNDKWTQISHLFNQNIKKVNLEEVIIRSGKQCRQRWYNRLDPELQNRSKWEQQQDNQLFDLYIQQGHKWLKLVNGLVISGFARRSDNNVKNHFHSTVRKSIRQLNKFIYYNNTQVKQSDQFKKNKKKYTYQREYSIEKMLKKQKKINDCQKTKHLGQDCLENQNLNQNLNQIQEMEQENSENFNIHCTNEFSNLDKANNQKDNKFFSEQFHISLQEFQQKPAQNLAIYKELFPELKEEKISKLFLLCQQKQQKRLQLTSTLLQSELIQIRNSFINYMRTPSKYAHQNIIALIKNIQKVNKSCKRINKRTLAKAKRQKGTKSQNNKQKLIELKIKQIFQAYLQRMPIKMKISRNIKKKVTSKIQVIVKKLYQTKLENQDLNDKQKLLQINKEEQDKILVLLQVDDNPQNDVNLSQKIDEQSNKNLQMQDLYCTESKDNRKAQSNTTLTKRSYNNKSTNDLPTSEPKVTNNKNFQSFSFLKQAAIQSPFKQGIIIPTFKPISSKNILNDSGKYIQEMFDQQNQLSKSIGFSQNVDNLSSVQQKRPFGMSFETNNNNTLEDFAPSLFISQINNPFNFFTNQIKQVNCNGSQFKSETKQTNLQKSLGLKRSNNFQSHMQQNNMDKLLLSNSLNFSNKSSFKWSVNYQNQPKVQRFQFQNSNFLKQIECKQIPQAQPCFFDFTKSQNIFNNIPQVSQQPVSFPFFSQNFQIPKKLIDSANSPGFPYTNFNDYSWNYNQNQSNLNLLLQKDQGFGFNSARLSDVQFLKQSERQVSKRSKSKDSNGSNMFHSQKFFQNSLQKISTSQGFKLKKNQILSNSCILSNSNKTDQYESNKKSEEFI